MSYTNPYGQPQGIPQTIASKIREALISEIIAINGYANHIANSNMQEVNAVWEEIMEDEKKHYNMFIDLIRKYDLTEYQLFLKHENDSFIKEPLQEYKPEYNKQLILNNIREDIKGESEAIILYEQLANELPYQDIIDVIDFVITDEKEHTEELTALLTIHDSIECDKQC